MSDSQSINKLVFIHLGTLPNALLIKNLKMCVEKFNTEIVLIHSKESDLKGLPEEVKTYTYNGSQAFLESIAERQVDLKFRKGYWNLTLERLFALLEYQIRHQETNLLHVESDVLLLPSFPVNRSFSKDKILWCEYGKEHDVAALFYIPTVELAKQLLSLFQQELTINPDLTDMQLMYKVRHSSTRVGLFQSSFMHCEVVENSSPQEPPPAEIFDGLALGMWLSGHDPRNNYGAFKIGDNSPFETGATGIDPSSYSYRVTKEGFLLVTAPCCGQSALLHNLHIHSKDKRFFVEEPGIRITKNLNMIARHGEVSKFSTSSLLSMAFRACQNKEMFAFLVNSPVANWTKRKLLKLVK